MAFPESPGARADQELEAINDEYQRVRTGYDAANKRVQGLTQSRDKLTGIVRPSLTLPGDRSTGFRASEQVSSVPGGVTALGATQQQLDKAVADRDSFTQPLRQAADDFRGYTDRAQANTLARQVGAPAIRRPALDGLTTLPAASSAPLPVPAVRPGPVVGAPAGGRTDPASGAGQAFTNSLGKHAIAPLGVTVAKDAAGRPVFDASGARLAAAGVAAPAAVAAPAVSVQGTSPQIQRPTFAGQAQGARIENPDEAQRRLEIALSGAAFAPARNRGARAAQGQMIDAIAGQTTQRNQIEADANRAQLDASTRTHIAQMGESGANYRAELVDAGDSQRMREAQEGETLRERLKIERPAYTSDGQGRYLEVDKHGIARPVVDARGEPVRMQLEGELTPIVRLDSLLKQLDSEQQSLQPNAERIASLRQQIDALTPGDKTATNKATGERIRLNSRSGEWEPIGGEAGG